MFRSARRGTWHAFDLAQPGVEVDVEVALALLRFGQLVRQHFDLAADLRDVGLDGLEVAQEVEPLVLRLLLERGEPRFEILLQLVEPRVGRRDALARFVVVEQRGVRRVCANEERKRDQERA